MTQSFGTLYVVATPIGNLGDMTSRGVQILRDVDVIAAEDTRHSKSLLQHFGIDKPLLSLHEHNEHQRVATLLSRLGNGENIALISDAGTPLLSDPGYVIVNEVRAAGINVSPVPGVSAITAALSAAGLPTDRFTFVGFLSAKSEARRQALEELSRLEHTVVLFESSHRILALLTDMALKLEADRSVVIARELTKRFETFLHGTASELLTRLEADSDQQRGEFVVLIRGAERSVSQNAAQLQHCLQTLLKELPLKQAVSLAAKLTGVKRNMVYNMALALKDPR